MDKRRYEEEILPNLVLWVTSFRKSLRLRVFRSVPYLLRCVDLDFISNDSTGKVFVVTLSEREAIHSFMQDICFKVILSLQDGAQPTQDQIEMVTNWSNQFCSQTTEPYEIVLADSFDRDLQRGIYCTVLVEQSLIDSQIIVGISKLVYGASKTYDPVNRTKQDNFTLRCATSAHVRDLADVFLKEITPSTPSIWMRMAAKIPNMTETWPFGLLRLGDDFSQSHAGLEEKAALPAPLSITEIVNSSLRGDGSKMLQDTITTESK